MDYIDAQAVRAAVDYGQAIDVLRQTVAGGFDPADDAARLSAPLPHGEFLFMPAAVGDYAAAKILTVTPDNGDNGLPRIQGICLLLDGTTHETKAIIDGIALTNLRTPAMSLAGVSEVLRRRYGAGVRIALFGNGVQAVPHVMAALAVVPVEHVSVIVRSPGRGAPVVDELRSLGIEAHEVGAADRAAALAEAGLVLTATSATEPLCESAEVPDDAIVVAMGSHSPQARELPGDLLARSTVIVESRHTAAAEAGDVVLAAAEGHCDLDSVLTFKEVVDSHGDVIPEGRPVVFKTTGMSWEDAAVAALIFERTQA